MATDYRRTMHEIRSLGMQVRRTCPRSHLFNRHWQMCLGLVLAAVYFAAFSIAGILSGKPDFTVRGNAVQVIVVTTTDDTVTPCTPANCSLRAAISLANMTAGEHTIELPAGIYTLTRTGDSEDENDSGDLDVLGPLTITGAGAQSTIIDGNGIDRVFHLRSLDFDPMQVFIEKVTIRGGETNDSGGGILISNGARLRLEEAVVSGNSSTSGDGGGGIYQQGSTLLVVRKSTFTDNESNFRGGAIAANGDFALENTTISGNRALLAGGIYSNDQGALRNVTLTDNNQGGLVVATGTSFVIQNTLIGGNEGPDCQGDIDSNGFNLVGTTCPLASSTSSDLTEDEIGLAPLALNGGQTPTHALLPDSPAIDAGNDGEPGQTGQACFTEDQRGVERPVDGNEDGTARCDIGSFEFVPDDPNLLYWLYMPIIQR